MLPRSGDTDGDRPDLWPLLSTWSVLLGPSVCWVVCPRLLISLVLSVVWAVCLREGEAALCPKESDGSVLLGVLKHSKRMGKPGCGEVRLPPENLRHNQ